MLLIDQMASKSSGGSHQSVPSSDIEGGSSPKASPRKNRTASVSHHPHGVTWTTTLGLLVHAAADGIAMGKSNIQYCHRKHLPVKSNAHNIYI